VYHIIANRSFHSGHGREAIRQGFEKSFLFRKQKLSFPLYQYHEFDFEAWYWQATCGHPLTHSLSLSHTHTIHTHSYTHTYDTHTLTLTLTLTLTAIAFIFSVPNSLSLSHTHTHSRMHACTHARTHSHSMKMLPCEE